MGMMLDVSKWDCTVVSFPRRLIISCSSAREARGLDTRGVFFTELFLDSCAKVVTLPISSKFKVHVNANVNVNVNES